MPQRKDILMESVRKLASLNLSDPEIIDNLKDAGVSEEEAHELLDEIRGESAAKAPVPDETPLPSDSNEDLSFFEEELSEDNKEEEKAEPKSGLAKPVKFPVKEEDHYDELLNYFNGPQEPKKAVQATSRTRSYLREVDSSKPSYAPPGDINKLWEKGVLATVDAKLGEMETLKQDIDTVIDAKIKKALGDEVRKIEVLMDSQRNLLVSKVDSTLERKSTEINSIIDSKISELRSINLLAQESIRKLEAQKGLSQSLLAEIDTKLSEIDKIKSSMLSEMNSEIMRSQSKVEDFLSQAQAQRDSLDERINKTLELESKITEGLMEDAKQKIDKLAISRGDELEAMIDDEMAKLKKIESKVNPAAIQQKIDEMYAAKEELLVFTKNSIPATRNEMQKAVTSMFREQEKQFSEQMKPRLNEIDKVLKQREKDLEALNQKLDPEKIISTLDEAYEKSISSKEAEYDKLMKQKEKELSLLSAEIDPSAIISNIDSEYGKFIKQKGKELDELAGRLDPESVISAIDSEYGKFVKQKEKEFGELKDEFDPGRINSTLEALEEFKQQFLKVVEKNVSEFNSTKKELAESMKRRDELIDQHIKQLDSKMAELTEFEKSFAKEMGLMIDELVEEKESEKKSKPKKKDK